MKKLTDTVIRELNSILLGKDHQVRLSLCGLLAKGHLLIEDIPGMGKTTLSHALAKVMGLTYQRIQFTNDLLPADVLGFSMYDKQAGSLVFHPGPIFAQVVLADEINRASPRTQSALLEAMEELLEGEDRRVMTDRLQSLLSSENLQTLQDAVNRVSTSPALLDYVQRLLEQSRRMPGLLYGLSPRAGLGLVRAARAWALMDGRHHVLPDDIQAVFPAVAEHRLEQGESGKSAERVRQLLTSVSVIE